MTRIPFDALSLPRFYPGPLKNRPSRAVYGIDTETLNGYTHLIAASSGSFLHVSDIDGALSFLTKAEFRKSLNFFWNLSYDTDSLLKYLPERALHEIIRTGSCGWGEYRIKIIPKKLLAITKGKQTYAYYDAMQFYDSSLDAASKRYLGEAKNPDNLDRSRIGTEPGYWRYHIREIERYCVHDATLTARLAERLQTDASEVFGFAPQKYISKAGLSKQYFRNRCEIPDIRKIPRQALEYFYNAYHGGRFEVPVRGTCGECSGIDINSAYPAVIAGLRDITAGKWVKTTKYHPEADYGAYLADITLPFMPLSPLAYNDRGRVIFPYGSWRGYFLKEEIETVKTRGDARILSGWEFFAHGDYYPFRESIEHLYAAKSESPKGSYRYSLYKIVMNSLYGAFFEKTRQPDGTLRAGMLFNPIYAALITGKTRLTLWEKAQDYGPRTISLATDGILITGEPNEEPSTNLGDWSPKEHGECLVLRSGIYEIGDETKSRGVSRLGRIKTPYGDYESIFEYLRDLPDLSSYPVILSRPVHLREAMLHTRIRTKEDINMWSNHEYQIDLNTEIKRRYRDTEIRGKTLLEKRIESIPWDIGDIPGADRGTPPHPG